MPAPRRATAPSSTDNATVCAIIKEQNKLASAALQIKIDTDSASLIDDMSKASTEDQIFSACGSPEDELEEATGADLDSFELNYLHHLYTVPDGDMMAQQSFTDAILPDAVAPPSLGCGTPAATVHAALRPESPPSSSSHSLSSHGSEEHNDEVSQPSTPPRDERNDAPWNTEPDSSPTTHSRAAQKSGSGRKRKASTMRGSPTPAPPAKMSRAAAAAAAREAAKEAAAAAAAAALSDDGDDSDCESSGLPTLDGLEIRPEDDPLGLFSRDPSTLTPEEQRLLKKQRRLLKNRESAQLSRHRKKMHLHSLEKMVDALKREKAVLAQKVQVLADDNERLRKQLIAS